jgi:hypothetical protein
VQSKKGENLRWRLSNSYHQRVLLHNELHKWWYTSSGVLGAGTPMYYDEYPSILLMANR